LCSIGRKSRTNLGDFLIVVSGVMAFLLGRLYKKSLKSSRRRMEVKNRSYNKVQMHLNCLNDEIEVLEFMMPLLAPVTFRHVPFWLRSPFIKREYF